MSENVFVGADSFRRLLLGAAGGYELQGHHEAAETVLHVIDALDELTTGGKGRSQADEDQEAMAAAETVRLYCEKRRKTGCCGESCIFDKGNKGALCPLYGSRWAGIDSEEKKMAERRIVDIGPLLEDLKKELEDLEGSTEALTVEEAAEDEIEELKALPVIDPERMIPAWRDPDKDPPKVETEVLVLYRYNGYMGITTAHYEDGNVFSQDSEWNWEDLPDWGTYDEERDDYRIPEGWWEYRHFNPDDVYNNKIDCTVVGWMPLPPKEVTQNGNQ